uniref:hypothetical protein n=1 Tax=Parerythrobacter lutipelagi TaxID=1964208 RepID=UPI0010F9892E|nr:hypothetical protein [Parerythrobacter lutipelagi]
MITAAATFLGGIALALVQPWILPGSTPPILDADKKLSVFIDDQFGLDGLAQARIAKNVMDRLEYREVDEVGDIDLGLATIRNEGEVDIPDFEATLISRVTPEERDFLAAGYMPDDGSALDETIPLDVGNGREVKIPIELLKAGESLTVWYVMSQNNMARLKVREPNVDVLSNLEMARRSVEEDRNSDEDSDEGFADWVFILIFSVAAFAAGAGLAVAVYEDLLKKVGFEPKELMDAYKEQLEKEKKGD